MQILQHTNLSSHCVSSFSTKNHNLVHWRNCEECTEIAVSKNSLIQKTKYNGINNLLLLCSKKKCKHFLFVFSAPTFSCLAWNFDCDSQKKAVVKYWSHILGSLPDWSNWQGSSHLWFPLPNLERGAFFSPLSGNGFLNSKTAERELCRITVGEQCCRRFKALLWDSSAAFGSEWSVDLGFCSLRTFPYSSCTQAQKFKHRMCSTMQPTCTLHRWQLKVVGMQSQSVSRMTHTGANQCVAVWLRVQLKAHEI